MIVKYDSMVRSELLSFQSWVGNNPDLSVYSFYRSGMSYRDVWEHLKTERGQSTLEKYI